MNLACTTLNLAAQRLHCVTEDRSNYTLTAKDPKQQGFGKTFAKSLAVYYLGKTSGCRVWGSVAGLEAGGLEAGGLEAGGLEAGGIEAGV